MTDLNTKIGELRKSKLWALCLRWAPSCILVIFLLFFTFHTGEENQNVKPKIQTLAKVLPVHLLIPRIRVDTNIEPVGVTSEGVMDTPSNSAIVGWFKLGSLPGEKGSAVISGHVDGEDGGAGVFAKLHKLKKGDKVYAKNSAGVTEVFEVKESRIYNPGYADEVFRTSDGAHLNLITCDGVWDDFKKSYSKRLVVFTDKVPLQRFIN